MDSELELESCLLSETALEKVAKADAAGYLFKKSGLGWYKYWFSLKGSRLMFFTKNGVYRGPLVGSVSLFNAKVVVADPTKRPLEIDVTDQNGKLHVLRAGSKLEMQYWLMVFATARRKIPPPNPIVTSDVKGSDTAVNRIKTKQVPNHMPVDRVLMVVHGIGAEEEMLEKNVSNLLETCSDVMDKVFPDISFNLELLVVHWRGEVLGLKTHDDVMKVIPTFQGSNGLRDFLTSRLLDIIYYTTDRLKTYLWKEVVSQLNAHYHEFKKRHPEFSGKICLFAHSLGGVIVYEILSKQVTDDPRLLESEGIKLDFEVESVYTLGSPLGGFLSLEFAFGTILLRPHKLPFRVYNIFHPNDPVAHRIEPIVDDRYTALPPAVLPHWKTMDKTQNAAKWLGGLWRKPNKPGGRERKKSEPEDGGDILPLVRDTFKPAKRFDFTLQVTSSIEEFSTAYSTMKAHTEYWTSRDVVMLLLSTMIRQMSEFEVFQSPESQRMSLAKFQLLVASNETVERLPSRIVPPLDIAVDSSVEHTRHEFISSTTATIVKAQSASRALQQQSEQLDPLEAMVQQVVSGVLNEVFQELGVSNEQTEEQSEVLTPSKSATSVGDEVVKTNSGWWGKWFSSPTTTNGYRRLDDEKQ